MGEAAVARLEGRLTFDTISSIVAVCLGYAGFVYVFIHESRRHIRVSTEKTLLEGEMAAAREVQQVIVPEQGDSLPGFKVDSVYWPAQEVGGDFFQILATADGGLLIVVGDVAGKGLKAGMLVALLVGAIRTAVRFDPDPLVVLDELNQRLLGRGDALATCQTLRITADGAVTLANAGHLPPYLNGEPIAIEGALPLGVSGEAEFSVARLQIAPGDQLMFMSDGIVEAMDPEGRLFGFERIHELLHCATTAGEVAAAARTHGQQDDISVISVTRTAVLEPVPA
jgi:serine phosphatase RsbU (regulator of sigma subunit)